METLTPPLLRAIQELRWLISAGHSMAESLRLYLEGANDAVASDFRERWTLKQQAGRPPCQEFRSPYQRALWEFIERGANGQPVLEPLHALEEEISSAAQAELDLHLSTLPFKVLLPLLFFQFPAYLLLLLGPMVRDLNAQMGGG